MEVNQMSKRPIESSSEEVVSTCATQKSKAEEEMHRFFAAVKTSLDGVIIGDFNGNITDVNDAVLRMYGSTDKDDLIGKSVLDLVVESDRERALHDSMESMRTGQGRTTEYRVLTKNGTEIPVEITTGFLTDERGKPIGFVDIIRNVAERKRAEALLESQQKFKALFMGNPEAAAHLGPDFQILDVNPRFEELFGYSLAEAKGKHINDVIVQSTKMEEAETLDKKAINGYVHHNTVRKRKDGSLIPVAVSAAPMMVEGKPVGYVAVYRDISDLKRAEKAMIEMMQKTVLMNEKLRVVGRLTRHDVRNKLSIITGNIYLNKKRLADHPDALESFKEMTSACEQIVRIFDFARDYEMLGVEELTYIDLEDAVQKAVSLFSDLNEVKVTNECHGLTVLADSLLRQVFYNLIDNSLKHGCRTTSVKLYFEKTERDELRLFYEDDGVGIPNDEKKNLFKEGYTKGKGSGYGLYLIKKIVEVYGWAIQETGEPNKGVQFIITIPKVNQKGKENFQTA
jgi:PAS domain S-box-containing protein